MSTVSKVIIVGAGLGGLACAVVCRRGELDVTILERATAISNVGAGIQIPPNSSRVLRNLGLLRRIRSFSTTVEHLDLRRYSDGQKLCEKPLGSGAIDEYGSDWMVIHREDYHKVMMDEALKLGARLILGASVKKLDSSGTTVTLEDGTTMSADVIIGADGLWSTMRENFLDHPSPPTETGDLAYRATFSQAQLSSLNDRRVEDLCSQKAVTLWIGPEKHVVFYPLRGGKEFNLVLIRPDNLPAGVRTSEGDLSEMRATFEGWDSILTKLISCISSVLKWKLMHHEELSSWVQGHAALLGDSCHPTLPYQAQGAAMAVEDGATLGFLLSAYKQSAKVQAQKLVDQDTLHSLLKLYEQLRKERTTLNVSGAYQNRTLYHMLDGQEQKRRDAEMKNFDFKNGRSEYKWLDTKYQKDLLGYDVLADAKAFYETWWESRVLEEQTT